MSPENREMMRRAYRRSIRLAWKQTDAVFSYVAETVFLVAIVLALILIPMYAFSHDGHGAQVGLMHLAIDHGMVFGSIAVALGVRYWRATKV